jgi:Tetratricopeptide repeat
VSPPFLLNQQDGPAGVEGGFPGLLDAVQAGGDIVGEAKILRRSGQVKSSLGDLAAAQGLLREALSLCEQTMDHAGSAEVRLELATVLAAQGSQSEAADLIGQAIITFTERNMMPARQRAERALQELAR